MSSFVLATENASRRTDGEANWSLTSLLEQIRADTKLSTAAEWEDGNKLRDGVFGRAFDDMVRYASLWTATPDNLSRKTAEMINAVGKFRLNTATESEESSRHLTLHIVKATILEPLSIRPRKSSWISTSSTASTAPFSPPPF